MRKLTGTVFGSQREWRRYEELLTATPNILQLHTFTQTDTGPVLSITNRAGIPTLIPLENSHNSAITPENIAYSAKFINLITSLDKMSDFQVQNAALPNLNLTDGIINELTRSRQVPIYIKTAALKAQIARLSFHSSIEKSIIRGFSVGLEREKSDITWELECLTSDLASESDNKRVKYARMVLNSITTVITCKEVPAEEISLLIAYIEDVWLLNQSNYYLTRDIEGLTSRPGLPCSYLLCKVISAFCGLISAVLTVEEQAAAKALFSSSKHSKFPFSTHNFSHLSHYRCGKVMFRMLKLAMEHKIPVKDCWIRLLDRTIDPSKGIFQVFTCLADYSEAEFTRIHDILCPSETEKAGILDIGKEEKIGKLVSFLRVSIGKRATLLTNPRLRPHIQLVFRKTKWYRYFLGYWVRVYSRIYEKVSDNERLNSDLHQIGSALFRLFHSFIVENGENKEIIRCKLNPLLYYLGIAEQAELIRELNDFSHYSPAHISHFLHHLLTTYSPEGVKASAYLWIEAIISNTDGTLKGNMQESVYSALEALWTTKERWAAKGMRLLAVCCVRNEPVRRKCAQLLPISDIFSIFKRIKDPVALEAALFAVAYIHAPVPLSKPVISLLTAALDLVETIPSLPKLREVLNSGLYEQVRVVDSVNFTSLYGGNEEKAAIYSLQLLSSGRFEGLKGGLAVLAPLLLTGNRGDKQRDSLLYRVNQAIQSVKATIQPMLKPDSQPLLLDLPQRVDTGLITPIRQNRPMQESFAEFICELNTPLAEIPAVLAWIYEPLAWKHYLAGSLLGYIQRNVVNASICAQVVLETLEHSYDPEICGPLWECLFLLRSSGLMLGSDRYNQLEKWVLEAAEIQTMGEQKDCGGIVQSMKITRLVNSTEYRAITEQFAEIYARAASSLPTLTA
jgi:hypothetical protein